MMSRISKVTPHRCHCEESDDEAIQKKPWIAALPLDRLGVARNDDCERLLA